MAAKLTRLTHKIAMQLTQRQRALAFQFSLQSASPETFGYTLVIHHCALSNESPHCSKEIKTFSVKLQKIQHSVSWII
jgi:hypothetical protein